MVFLTGIKVVFIASCFINYTGYITHVSSVVSENSINPNFTIKLKVDVDKYETVRLMLFKTSAAIPGFFKSDRQNVASITLKKVATTSSGVKFYNSYRGCLVVDALNSVNFKVDDKTTQEVQTNGSGTYTVTGCLRWITEIQGKINRDNLTRFRECPLKVAVIGNWKIGAILILMNI